MKIRLICVICVPFLPRDRLSYKRLLKLSGSECRFMILNDVESDLVGPVEATLIRRYKPLWNVIVDGFGNHDPDSGRYNQAKSEWGVLHPGRTWTERLTGIEPNLSNIITKVQTHLAGLELS